MPEDCGVVLLAGGRSSRMGTPKAWLEFDGRPLLEHLVERMLAVFSEAVVVTGPGQEVPRTAARVVFDDRPGEGPVAGIAVGLRELDRPLAFVSSCDVPFLSPALARHLVSLAGDHDVVVPEWGGRLHPLLAVYRTSVSRVAEEQLAAGRRRVLDLLDRVRTRVVGEEELRAPAPGGRSFLNVNTPEDYREALALWSTLKVEQAFP